MTAPKMLVRFDRDGREPADRSCRLREPTTMPAPIEKADRAGEVATHERALVERQAELRRIARAKRDAMKLPTEDNE